MFTAQLNPVKGSEQAGTRPVVIVSRDAINKSSTVVICVPVTDRRNCSRIYPSQIELAEGAGGLKMTSVALGEQVRAIHKSRLLKRLGQLSQEDMRRIETALKNALDLSR